MKEREDSGHLWQRSANAGGPRALLPGSGKEIGVSLGARVCVNCKQTQQRATCKQLKAEEDFTAPAWRHRKGAPANLEVTHFQAAGLLDVPAMPRAALRDRYFAPRANSETAIGTENRRVTYALQETYAALPAKARRKGRARVTPSREKQRKRTLADAWRYIEHPGRIRLDCARERDEDK